MPDSNQSLERKNNNNETPKKHPFGGSLMNAKELLDFRYNTQEEIDKFNEEITMPENLDEIINKTKNNNDFEERKNKYTTDTEPKKDLQGSKVETYNNQNEPSKVKINYETGIKREETNETINNTDKSNYENGSIEGETHNEQLADNTKIFDPFELNFDNFDENRNDDEEEQEDKKEDKKETQRKDEEKKNIEGQTQQDKDDDDEIISPFKDEDEQKDKEESNDKDEDKKEIQSKKEEKIDILEQTQQSKKEEDDVEDDEIISPFKDEDEQKDKEESNDKDEDKKKVQDKQERKQERKQDEEKKNTKEDEEELIGITNNKEKDTTKGKKIKHNENETEQGDEEINTTEDDKEYTKEEIFEQEPEFFANDELSQQFLELVKNTRNILRLEQRNGNQDNYFKIIGGKTEDKTLEYSFYLIEEPDEPIDLYIKKVETNKENEETEHLVQFSYNKNKELNIFVDEVILYENINKADPETTEYIDTKSILEKFIFLTENYYNEINAKLEEELKEKQKKKQLQQIFKGF